MKYGRPHAKKVQLLQFLKVTHNIKLFVNLSVW